MKKVFMLVMLVLTNIALVYAEDVTFTNASGDGYWSNPENWDKGHVPGLEDKAIISSGPCIVDDDISVFEIVVVGYNRLIVSCSTITITNFGISCDAVLELRRSEENGGIISIQELDNGYISRFRNYGTVEETVCDDNLIVNILVGNFENDGFMQLMGVINLDITNQFENSKKGVIRGSSFIINCMDGYNEGEINATCPPDDLMDSKIESGSFGNWGKIVVDNEEETPPGKGNLIIRHKTSEEYDGGSFTNNKGGKVAIESVISSGTPRGRVFFNGKKMINMGRFGVRFPGNKSLKSNLHPAIVADVSNDAESLKNTNNLLLPPLYSDISMVADSIWIVGDTSECISAKTIRFVFNYLSLLGIDSIMDIYAGEKIEFFGVAGSILDLQFNYVADLMFVNVGTIEIHSDSIIEPPSGINFICRPDPVVGPSDTTFTQIYVESRHVFDHAGTDSTFKITVQNQSTANKSFSYSVSSTLGWVENLSDTTRLLHPFEFDSLMIDYSIPVYADTLIDTLMVIFSVPGSYSDTTYSYIHSHPALPVGFYDFKENNNDLSIKVFPNPFSDALTILTQDDASIRIIDMNGKTVQNANTSKGKPFIWFPEEELANGLYLIQSVSNNKKATKRLILSR
jgi:hypothetical protein